MPLTEDVEVTDNLVVHFAQRCKEAENFTVIIANKGKRSVKVKKISSSLDFILVLNFNELNSVINANTQISYLFEARNERLNTSDLNEGKIRFTFKNHTHVTRVIKIMYGSMDKKSMLPKIADEKIPTSLTPGIINLQGFIKRDYDNWLNKFDDNKWSPIEVTDDLHIEFDHFHSSPLCEIRIRNNTWKKLCLDLIEMDESMITMCDELNGKSMTIGPRDDLKLQFKAKFNSEKFASNTKICFRFGEIRVRRTITIQYRLRGSAIPKSEYEIPAALNDLIASKYRISRSEYVDALDQWIPSPEVNYAKHFHNLLYLEECGLRKEIQRNYLQKEAFFGNKEVSREDGKRKEYAPGVYDLQIKDLFEIRPSLQPGII